MSGPLIAVIILVVTAGEPAFVSGIYHTTFVEVDEDGTEAAAAKPTPLPSRPSTSSPTAAPERVGALVLLVPAGMVKTPWWNHIKSGIPMTMFMLAPSPKRLKRFLATLLTTPDDEHWTGFLGDAFQSYNLSLDIPMLSTVGEFEDLQARPSAQPTSPPPPTRARSPWPSPSSPPSHSCSSTSSPPSGPRRTRISRPRHQIHTPGVGIASPPVSAPSPPTQGGLLRPLPPTQGGLLRPLELPPPLFLRRLRRHKGGFSARSASTTPAWTSSSAP